MANNDSPLSTTVAASIAVLFDSKNFETVTEMLTEECNAKRLRTTSADGLERIQLAVLKLSNGEVDKFLAAVELAQLDWRDVLVAAGFGNDLEAHLTWAEEIQE